MNPRVKWHATVVRLCLAFFCHPAFSLLTDEQNNVEIYQKCNPGVVNITATTLTRDFFFDIVPQRGLGSGAIIRPDGYILTNHHVVGNAVDVEVTLHDKAQFPAKVVGLDPDSDLALIRISTQGKPLTSLEFGSADSLVVGQKVLAIGNPFGLGGSLSVGIVSSLGRDIRATNQRLIKDVIQTDAAINVGNSGGPLLDSAGKLIGINTQIVSASGGSHGVGFAISVKTLKPVAEQLIQFGRVLRPELGIEAVGFGEDLLRFLGIPIPQGVMIVDMDPGGLAAKYGFRAATGERRIGFRIIPIGGDILFQIDNTPISTGRDILDTLADKKPGDTMTVQFVRGREKRSVTIKLNVPKKYRGNAR